jgi:hypothetical protein
MRPLIATVAVFGAALAVPAVRHRVVHLLARAGRGTNVHVVPAPRSR